MSTRNRITRRQRAERNRVRLETLGIIRREFDWEGLDNFDPVKVFDPHFLSAIDHFKKTGNSELMRNLLYNPDKSPGAPDRRIYGFKMFSEEFREALIQGLDRFNAFAAQADHMTPPRRAGSKYGVVLNNVGFEQFFDKVTQEYIQPLAQLVYPELAGNGFSSNYTFLVKYELGKETRIYTHADNADLTVNICLGRKFEGGKLFFYGVREDLDEKHYVPPLYPSPEDAEKPAFWYNHQVGEGVFHLSKQYHGAEDIQSGERCNLIIWCRSNRVQINENQAHWNSVFEAVRNGENLDALVEYLQSDDAKPNDVDNHGRSLLHLLTIGGLLHAASLLLKDTRVDCDAVDSDGLTSLHYAAASDDEGLVKALLQAGANINARTRSNKRTRLVEIHVAGRTPLHVATVQKPPSKNAAKILVELGCDQNTVDDKGGVPDFSVIT
eukprot:TRINITY_DN41445_c0_g1_i1.p1 TRINITY_DN41445_c0_g1~~TRINITY_DN41445_c0_g1_i1.p1  ORF type:complete len:448 (+),score=116.14 TRINITY_DN41445_c0_g1_i1:30-1346(+)